MARPKGSVNRVSKEAGQLILAVFDGLGGVERMIKWAEETPENLAVFYVHIFPKILRGNTLAYMVGDSCNVQNAVNFNAVNVTDPQQALTVLERLENARNAHRGSGGESYGGEVAGVLSAHPLLVQAPDGGDAGSETTEGVSDATATREDDADSDRLSVSLPHTVPVA